MKPVLFLVCVGLTLSGCGSEDPPAPAASTGPRAELPSTIQDRSPAISELQKNMQFEDEVSRRLKNGESANKVLDDVLAHDAPK